MAGRVVASSILTDPRAGCLFEQCGAGVGIPERYLRAAGGRVVDGNHLPISAAILVLDGLGGSRAWKVVVHLRRTRAGHRTLDIGRGSTHAADSHPGRKLDFRTRFVTDRGVFRGGARTRIRGVAVSWIP